MSFRDLTMTNIREVLRRWQAGQSARAIARDRVVDRKTAGRYIEAAVAEGLEKSTELTDGVVCRVAARVQIREAPPRSESRKVLDKHREQIETWLKGPEPLRLTRIQELLVREGVTAAYTTLRRYASTELGWHEPKSTVLIDDPPPGEEAQIDYGEMGYVKGIDGKLRKLWVLIVTLSMSRYQFVWPSFYQTVEALVEGLDAAWRFFGGVTMRVVPDNLTAAVIKARPEDPQINESFAEYAQSRGFFVDPARVRKPQDKPRVENQVAYVRERWFAGEVFNDDLRNLREHAERWCKEVAGARIHGTTRRVPFEVFQQEEVACLLPAPQERFDIPSWTTAKVHPDHHIQVAKALYSVPTKYLHQQVRVRLDSKMVRIYFRNELIKTHQRVAPGKRSTDPSDYPVGKAPYARRSVEGIISQAKQRGVAIGEFAERLLAGPLPWVRMRQGYGLLRLCDKYGTDRVETLCSRSLSFDVVDVPRLERMLKRAFQSEKEAEPGRVVALPTSRFARSPEAFATMTTKAGEP